MNTDPQNAFERLLRMPAELAEEVSSVLPRLVERSKEQIAVAAVLIEKLGCTFSGDSQDSSEASTSDDDGGELADVVSLDTVKRGVEAASASLADLGAGVAEVSETIRAVASSKVSEFMGSEEIEKVEVTVVDAAPAKKAPAKKAASTSGAKKAPAKKAPAKKAPAKKAGSTSGAKKAPAKKAGSTSGAKKAPAKKAPAKKAPAKKAPAKKAPAKKAPAQASANPELAIAEYDALAASQVIPRLESLSASELEAIRVYEVSTRGRRTILGRVAQLQNP